MIPEMTCKICREPINNRYCVHCLSASIKRQFPVVRLYGFDGFHKIIYASFFGGSFEGGSSPAHCRKCRKGSAASLCLHCYISEVILWLGENDVTLSRVFMRLFSAYPFNEEGSLFSGDETVNDSQGNKDLIIGHCENCGSYSESLEDSGSMLRCRECSDEGEEEGVV